MTRYNYTNVPGFVKGKKSGEDLADLCGTGLIVYEEGLLTITVENNGYLFARVDINR